MQKHDLQSSTQLLVKNLGLGQMLNKDIHVLCWHDHQLHNANPFTELAKLASKVAENMELTKLGVRELMNPSTRLQTGTPLD
jgi:hypothetical protein